MSYVDGWVTAVPNENAEIKEECQLVTNEIATKLKVSEAKLLLRWGLQHGYCVLTKSSKPERIREDLNLFDFEIPDNDMERLNRLNQNQAFAWAVNGLNPMEVASPSNKFYHKKERRYEDSSNRQS